MNGSFTPYVLVRVMPEWLESGFLLARRPAGEARLKRLGSLGMLVSE
jgi:hypothetical protein